MAYDSMIFYRSFWEAVRDLDPKMQVDVYNAIFEYGLDGNEPDAGGVIRAIFTLVKPQIDANISKRLAGKKGGESKGEANQSNTEADRSRPKQTEAKSKQTTSNLKQPEANVNVNDNVNVNVNDNVNVNANDNVDKNKRAVRYADDDRLNNAVMDFIDHRKKIKKPMSDRAVELLIGRVQKLAPTVEGQVELINLAIVKGWQTVYPNDEKIDFSKAGDEAKKQDKLDQLEAYFLNGGQ